MKISSDSQFEIATHAAFRQIEDEVVIVDTKTNRMMTLNETGATIWSSIKSMKTGEIVDEITKQFDVTKDQAALDVDIFVNALLDKGLVTLKK